MVSAFLDARRDFEPNRRKSGDMFKSIARSLLAGVLLIVMIAGMATSAEASVAKTYCNGKSYQSLVKTYQHGAQTLALRCGTASWGFKHVTSRWNAAYDSMIALTIAQGEKVTDLQGDGGSAIFVLFGASCNELFRVIYNGRAYLGTGVSPQGIITAYYPTGVGTAAVAAAGYRTNCTVTQSI
jgi:hypothetical protein